VWLFSAFSCSPSSLLAFATSTFCRCGTRARHSEYPSVIVFDRGEMSPGMHYPRRGSHLWMLHPSCVRLMVDFLSTRCCWHCRSSSCPSCIAGYEMLGPCSTNIGRRDRGRFVRRSCLGRAAIDLMLLAAIVLVLAQALSSSSWPSVSFSSSLNCNGIRYLPVVPTTCCPIALPNRALPTLWFGSYYVNGRRVYRISAFRRWMLVMIVFGEGLFL